MGKIDGTGLGVAGRKGVDVRQQVRGKGAGRGGMGEAGEVLCTGCGTQHVGLLLP